MPFAERRFRTMGCDAHLVTVGPEPAARLDAGQRRLVELEARWSRFVPTSEISRLNNADGAELIVSRPTFELVSKAVAGSRITQGRFDPLLLGPLRRLGYERDFADLSACRSSLPPPDSAVHDPVELDEIRSTVRVPRDVEFDPGGIGKGLAADLVAEASRAAGARGVLVNLGGDIRVSGVSPTGGAWTIEIREPQLAPDPITTIHLAAGAATTSTTLKRRWTGPEGDRHHLLDPTTGLPHEAGAVLATVVAGSGWWAEVAATASIGDSPPDLPAASILRIAGDGGRERIGGFERYES